VGIYVGCLSLGGPRLRCLSAVALRLGQRGWKALEELGIEGDGELAKLAGWARQCLHPGNERLGALLFLLAAQRPEARRRYPQLAKAAAEKMYTLRP